jgi:ribosome-associated protein
VQITPALSISDDELTFTFIRASGPGGQNVNKVATAVQLRFDVGNSPSLPVEVKERLTKTAGAHMTQDGVLIIEARHYRTQEQNRADAEIRLKALLEKALRQPKIRHPTKPSLHARAKRIESKKKRGAVKRQRMSVDD